MNRDAERVLRRLRSMASASNVEGMARFGISSEKTLGVSVTELRRIAKEIGKSHELALELWDSGIHEARILAAIVDEPGRVTEEQMESWVRDADSWDVCDQVCGCLFDRTPFAYGKAIEWSGRSEEFVKRAGFALMAALAVHDKNASDESFEKLFLNIKAGSTDERHYVKKAVNWALRQIGKRNLRLNTKAVDLAEEMRGTESRTAKWIASDALRELRSDAVLGRLRSRSETPRRN